jgi:hypothetical protein
MLFASLNLGGRILGLSAQYRIAKSGDKGSRGLEIAKSGNPFVSSFEE